MLRWVKHALAHGADAIMLRETLDTSNWHVLLLALADKYPNPTFHLLLNGYYTPDARVQGYHFREHSFPLGDRFPSHLLGKSVHSQEAAQAAVDEGYDYLVFSPVFATDTHPGQIPAGLSALEAVCRNIQLPVFALGGITNDNESLCLDVGAWGTAAIGRYALPY